VSFSMLRLPRLSRSATMRWTTLSVRQFDECAHQWDEIATTCAQAAPFLRSVFLRPLLREFANGKEIVALGEHASGERAAAILVPGRRGTWQTFQPSQLPLGALVATTGIGFELLRTSLLGCLPGFATAIGFTQQDPRIFARPQSTAALASLEYIDTAWVDVQGSFDSFWSARGKNLRQNIRKQQNRLAEEKIQTRLDVLVEPARVAEGLRHYGALESAGWKAGGGTAVHPDNPQGRFYRAMLESFCAEGRGRIYCYWFNDHVVAVDLCIESAETLVILKTTYDESIRAYSPAFLMRHEAFRPLFNEGRVRRIEFYGKLMQWHQRWTDNVRTLYHVNTYRWSWVRGLHEMRRRFDRPAKAAATDSPQAASSG